MAKSSTSKSKQLAAGVTSGWLTIGEAAELCGASKADLRMKISKCQLRAFTVERGKKVQLRVTRADLIEAGYFGAPQNPLAAVDLLDFIREQNHRISALEDQRAQMAVQLGIALERLRSVDERMSELEHAGHVNVDQAIVEPPFVGPNGEVKGTRTARAGVLRRSLVRVAATAGNGRPWKREAGRSRGA